MPVIKKRITAEYLEREQQRSEQNGRNITDEDVDMENSSSVTQVSSAPAVSSLKRKAPGAQMLKGLDGEVLIEKRKRTLPPAEQKLDTWLENNLEKKAESTLSVMKLYQFYTDMCQQDATFVVEMDVFRSMLHNKFGKEFGLKETSPYSGLMKETKPRKKPVVAPSLGYKMKDLILEALKASGNPTKGMMFAWVKKFIAAKYPALQIEFRPHFLKKALEREIYAGRVELVKGIGFCGFYRLPGPPDNEEVPKSKKKSGKKGKKSDENSQATNDMAVETDNDTEGEEKSNAEENEEITAERTEEKTKQKQDKEKNEEGTKEASEEGDDKKKEKKKQKKRKRTPKNKASDGSRHSNPQTLNDIFPLAMTYMAEPKEASFARIKKYLEKYYGKVDIDAKLKKCMEHGCETGMWDRVTGSGASGSFQLQVDSFNPEHTESMTDMVCSAIIACTEPKTSSVRLLKSYISEYHPEFNIDTRPLKLRNALERAVKQNQLRRISGIGMSGSFQLVEPFTPSPSILAGDEDGVESEGEVDLGKAEVYVIRKTKSGRRAPLEKTQLDFSPSYKKKGSGSGGGKKKLGQRRSLNKKSKDMDSDTEEDESSSSPDEEPDIEEEAYRPRATKSRGGKPDKSNRNQSKVASPKVKSKTSTSVERQSKSGKLQNSPKKNKMTTQSARKQQPKETDNEDEVVVKSQGKQQNSSKKSKIKAKPSKKQQSKETESASEVDESKDSKIPPPVKLGRSSNGSTPLKRAAKKITETVQAETQSDDDDDDMEDDFVIEVEKRPVKKGRGNNVAASPKKITKAPNAKKPAKKRTVVTPTPDEGRTPRSAFKSARKSLKEVDSGDESSEEEYVERRSSSRGSRKRLI